MQAPTVLVVDDEQLIRWSLSDRLTQEGYRVLATADGMQLVGKGYLSQALFQQFNVRGVILDQENLYPP